MQTLRKKKSEPLTREELKAFKVYIASFNTLTDAAENLGVNAVGVMTRAMNYGSAAPETVAKIRAKISV